MLFFVDMKRTSAIFAAGLIAQRFNHSSTRTHTQHFTQGALYDD